MKTMYAIFFLPSSLHREEHLVKPDLPGPCQRRTPPTSWHAASQVLLQACVSVYIFSCKMDSARTDCSVTLHARSGPEGPMRLCQPCPERSDANFPGPQLRGLDRSQFSNSHTFTSLFKNGWLECHSNNPAAFPPCTGQPTRRSGVTRTAAWVPSSPLEELRALAAFPARKER